LYEKETFSTYSPEKKAGIELYSILTPIEQSSEETSLERQEEFLREVFHSPSLDWNKELSMDLSPPLRSDNPIESDQRFSFDSLDDEDFEDDYFEGRIQIGAELGLLNVSPSITTH
jgi:hypothetical protein